VLVHKVFKELQEVQDRKVFKELQALQDRKVFKELQVRMVLQDQLVHKARKAHKA
jgi:hypothetical protein